MNATTRNGCALLACLGWLASAAPAAAEPPGAADRAPAAAPDESADWATWIQQLETEAKKLRELRSTEAALQEEVGRALSRRYPRGAEKDRLLAAHERARDDLAETQQQLAELTEQARQAGVPQGMLQDYEELAEPPPASGTDDESDF